MRLFAGTPWDRPPKCDRCGQLESACQCPPAPPPAPRLVPPSEQTARIVVEKRSKGKQVTVVRGLSAAGNDLPALLSRLQTQCGAGGSIQGECLEIQGQHRERIRAVLTAVGYRVSG